MIADGPIDIDGVKWLVGRDDQGDQIASGDHGIVMSGVSGTPIPDPPPDPPNEASTHDGIKSGARNSGLRPIPRRQRARTTPR